MMESQSRYTDEQARSILRTMFDAAVARADVRAGTLRCLPKKPNGRCVVVGAGKASTAMAAALDEAWPDVDVSGIVVTRYGHSVPAGRIEILEAAHPVPDAASQQAAKRILEAIVSSVQTILWSPDLGRRSSLMALPIEGVTLGQKIEIHRALISSGATITEINTVRNCLSAVKGGRLALACQPARLVTLVVNDIPGDDLSLVASGPTMRSEIAIEEVEAIVDRYRIDLCGVPRSLLTNGPKVPAHFEQDVRVVACPWYSLLAASSVARASAIDPRHTRRCDRRRELRGSQSHGRSGARHQIGTRIHQPARRIDFRR